MRLAIDFDQQVRAGGIVQAARWVLLHYLRGLHSNNVEFIPDDGPLILVSNHPGVIDIMVLAACVGRSDIKMVAREMPFLRALNAKAGSLIFTSHQQDLRSTAVRHLQAGGILILFSGGR